LGWFGLLSVFAAVTGVLLGTVTEFTIALGASVNAGFCLRAARSGILLGHSGVELRTALRTYRWSWGEIDWLELKPRGYIPRLRIHFRDGRVKMARRFFARRSADEERCQALFAALEDRLEVEHASWVWRGMRTRSAQQSRIRPAERLSVNEWLIRIRSGAVDPI
jgi:hypothetical protein